MNVLTEADHSVNIKKGDKKVDPSELFGIWADDPRSLEEIRKSGWQRKSVK